MSTVKTTNITHGSNSGTANMVWASDGKVTIPEKKLVIPGAVVQIQQTVKTDKTSLNGGGAGSFTAAVISCNITPEYSTSKILIQGHLSIGGDFDSRIGFAFFKAGSIIQEATGDAAGSRIRTFTNESIKDNYHINSLPFSYLTAAVGSSGSAIAYDLRVVVGSGSNQDLTINSAYNENDGNTRQRTCSILQLWEIAA